ncbi:MAG TPA: molybdopterin cofactor-binding domain-containing protein, partial [Burkholderiales bacterium]|nr:molybdopterin cofactor-binding domain-containing protein [Burkholderiales bacterium]
MSKSKPMIGAPVERLEDLRLLRGRGCFVDDLHRDGMLHAVILRSPVAHGRIRALDASAARAMPGVHGVITAAELGTPVPLIPLRLQPMESIDPYRQPVLAHGKVRYVGEPLAVVLADSPALAEDALERIALDIEPLPAVTGAQASARDEVLLFEATGTNRPTTFTGTRGNAEAAFESAAYVRRERFEVQRQSALTLEPRGFLAEWDAARARLTVYGAAKVPYFNRRAIARMMGLAEEAIDLIENDVGGGFGSRGEFYPEDFLIPFAARWSGRPVKWIEDRR